MTVDSSTASKRSIGAMFFSIFGGVWLGLGAWLSLDQPGVAMVLVALCSALMFTWARGVYRRHSSSVPPTPPNPAEQRRENWFHWINGGQWILVLIVTNVLNNIGLRQWDVPAAMAVVGLHFLPLAAILRNPVQYWTGAGFLANAAAYPFLSPGGPMSGVGPAIAGAILWASAAANLRGVGSPQK